MTLLMSKDDNCHNRVRYEKPCRIACTPKIATNGFGFLIAHAIL